jgi:hypothetical protein
MLNDVVLDTVIVQCIRPVLKSDTNWRQLFELCRRELFMFEDRIYVLENLFCDSFMADLRVEISRNSGSSRTADPDSVKCAGNLRYAAMTSINAAKIKRCMIANGGPILMMQIENEYGAYFQCNRGYIKHLCDLTKRALGGETILFTTDQLHEYQVDCGTLPAEALVTVDFGVEFEAARMFWRSRDFPSVNSEFCPDGSTTGASRTTR